jgi:UDP-3-O-[3-hydroxymyristoyl] glucosamine N-acyltransferase
MTTASIASLVSGRLDGRGDIAISRPASMKDAGAGEITLMTTPAFAGAWGECGASAAFVTEGIEVSNHDPATRALIVVENAQHAMITLLEQVAPPISGPATGIHATAVIASTATVSPGASIGALVTIGDRTDIQDGAIIHDGVRIGCDVKIGRKTRLQDNVVVGDRCTIGQRCRIFPGVVIGGDGFGYVFDDSMGKLRKVPQIGNVILDDEVEIGANATVDRGKYGATRIGFGTKIDNLVQVGHNATIGKHCVLASGIAVGGSATICDGVMIGGQAGIRDHITVGAGSRIGAQSGVVKDVPPGASLFGTPAQNAIGMLKGLGAIPKLPELLRQVGTSPRP